MSSIELKEEGNTAYKNGDWETALEKYTAGLKIADNSRDKVTLLKNRAAVFLKMNNYDDVIKDASLALEISPNDPKAFFRRAYAYNELGNHEKAYTDVRAAQNYDPKNRDIISLLSALHKTVQEKIEKNSQINNKVIQMFDIIFDVSNEKDKRETAANNLVALAKEKSGADVLMEQNIFERFSRLLPSEKDPAVRLGCIRTLSEFSKDVTKAKAVLKQLGLPFLIDLMNSPSQDQVNATQYVFQTLLSTLSGCDIKTEKAPDEFFLQENKSQIDSVMYILTTSITSRAMTAACRDSIIELLCKNAGYKVLNWGDKFIRAGGVFKLLEVASELPEYHYESCIDITENTRMTTAICLAKIYETQYDDKSRNKFIEIVDEFFKEKLVSPDIESKVRATVTLTTLLLGPLELGNTLIGREGIVEMLLVMAGTDDVLQQKVACEALIAAATKKDKCRAIMTQGTNILKNLFKSKDDSIKVRALVGLCKLGSLGGTDASMKPFADGASLKLAEACRRYLINPTKDRDMRRWACEGLSYLTLDAEVKEKLIEDRPALRSMFELAKSGDMNCLYGVVTTLVNLCNAYDKQEIIPEMMELAKFAKQHIPEEHDLDDKDFVDKRVNILAEEGACIALVALSKTQSENSRELISRIFNAFCEIQENRGKVVQQGGTKALLDLALNGTSKGKKCASQALARIGITINPEVAFPGQRSYEVVRPLLKLLDMDCTALENFESLMALCNLAGVSQSTRQRILKEGGLSMIDHYTFEDHELIRRAAFQCLSNMCSSPDVVKIMEGENDKLKYLFLCTSDEDDEIVKACTGGICMVLSQSEILCNKVFDAKDWQEVLQFLLSHKNPEVQYRGTFIFKCLAATSKDIARKIINTHCKEALVAICKIGDPEVVLPKAQECAKEALDLCVNYELISDPFKTDDDD